jgi:tetrahydromethanopterin S-methyltransferase subunit B
MSRMSWPAAPGPERLVLLSAPGRDAVLATAAVLLTAGVFAAVGEHSTLTGVQRLDDGWLRLMVAGILLGTACAVVTALIVGQLQRHVEGRQRPA